MSTDTIPISTGLVYYADMVVSVSVRKLRDDIIQVKTDFTGLLTVVHPLISTLEKCLDTQGFYVKHEVFNKRKHGSWLWFGITKPGKPRIFYFRVVPYVRCY